MIKVVIDRFEDDFVVCEKEDREMIEIERGKVPTEAKEGDVLNISKDEIVIDIQETVRRKKEIEDLTKDLWA